MYSLNENFRKEFHEVIPCLFAPIKSSQSKTLKFNKNQHNHNHTAEGNINNNKYSKKIKADNHNEDEPILSPSTAPDAALAPSTANALNLNNDEKIGIKLSDELNKRFKNKTIRINLLCFFC